MHAQGKPVNTGEIREIEVTGFSHNGEGVGKINGFAVFIPQGIPGEQVQVRVTEVRSSFARGHVQQVLTPSRDRVSPPCPVFGICGGCQLQHIAYSRQLELKRELLVQALKRIGRIGDIGVLPTAGMENPWRYRNKGQFHAGKEGGRVALGFFKPGSHELVTAGDCLLFSRAVNSLLGYLEQVLSEAQVEVYDQRNGTGWLRNVVIRESSATGEIMVIFVTAGSRPVPPAIWEELLTRFPNLVSVYQNVNRRSSPVVMGADFILLHGKPAIQDRIGHLSFKISPSSFFQVNSVQTSLLSHLVQEMAGLDGSQTVIDAYSGVGTIALFLARRTKKVIAIESSHRAVADARTNARENGVTNVQFLPVRVEEWVAEGKKANHGVDVVVVDPPRRGLNPEFVEALLEMKPPKLIYVSCNPATLARDLGHLANQGYTINAVQPVDMFPQTAHVETVVLMSRVK